MTKNTGPVESLLHVAVLCAFAFAQPVFDILSRNVEFFIVHDTGLADILLMILALVIVIPLPIVGIEIIARVINTKVYNWLHFLVLSTLFTLIMLPVTKRLTTFPGEVLIFVAGLTGLLLGAAVMRYLTLRKLLAFMAPVLLIFPAYFLLSPSIYGFISPKKVAHVDLPPVNASAPVVMVIFDELSLTALMDERSMIDPVRYPNFASLAKDAYWFRNATTVSDDTVRGAVPSILTGRYPYGRQMAQVENAPLNLFTLLGGSYSMNVNETYTKLCPEYLCPPSKKPLIKRLRMLFADLTLVYAHIVLPVDLARNLPQISQDWKNFWPKSKEGEKAEFMENVGLANRERIFESFIDGIRADEQPSLNFLHILLPHIPFIYLPSGNQYQGEKLGFYGIPGLDQHERWSNDDWATIQGYQRYLLQTGYVDRLIGNLVKRLRSEGLYEKSLIVITSDHGISFRKNDSRRQLTKSNYLEIMPIPLFIKIPYQKQGIIDDRNVETIDILPTIVDILDIKTFSKWDGFSIRSPLFPERTVKTISQQNRRAVSSVFKIPAANFSGKYQILKEKHTVFGTGDWRDKLLRIGPYSSLIGKKIEQLDVIQGITNSLTVQLDESDSPSIDEEIASTDLIFPVTGYVHSNNPSVTIYKPRLAIVVNGTVSAVTMPFFSNSENGAFFSFVPGTFFSAEKNNIVIYQIYGNSEKPQLRQLYVNMN